MKVRWPSVKLVFDPHVDLRNAGLILGQLRRRFLMKSDSLNINSHPQDGAFRITVQVLPEQEEQFRREVTRTEGIYLDE